MDVLLDSIINIVNSLSSTVVFALGVLSLESVEVCLHCDGGIITDRGRLCVCWSVLELPVRDLASTTGPMPFRKFSIGEPLAAPQPMLMVRREILMTRVIIRFGEKVTILYAYKGAYSLG